MPPELCAPAAAFLAHESVHSTVRFFDRDGRRLATRGACARTGIARDGADSRRHRRKPADVMNLHDASVTESAAPDCEAPLQEVIWL